MRSAGPSPARPANGFAPGGSAADELGARLWRHLCERDRARLLVGPHRAAPRPAGDLARGRRGDPLLRWPHRGARRRARRAGGVALLAVFRKHPRYAAASSLPAAVTPDRRVQRLISLRFPELLGPLAIAIAIGAVAGWVGERLLPTRR